MNNADINDILNLLTLKSIKGIGTAYIKATYRLGMSDTEVSKLSGINNFFEIKEWIRNAIQPQIYYGCKAISYLNAPLLNRPYMPLVLFYKGNISLLNDSHLRLAVIGTRNINSEIETKEREIVREILHCNTKKEKVIVSGLAIGCDTVAHITALDDCAKTIAILPSPITYITPMRNVSLAQRIAENGGLLISEYYIDPNTIDKFELKKQYSERDELQAVFSDAVLLCASDTNGGSRIALNKAKAIGRHRGVIEYISDDPIFNLNFALSLESSVGSIKTKADVKEWIARVEKDSETNWVNGSITE